MFDDKIYQQRTAAQPSCLSEQTMRRGSMLVKLCCVILLIIQRDTESTQVIGGSRTVVQGEDVDLSCRLIETTDELEQITWQKSTVEEKQNHNFLLIYPNGVTKFIALNGLSARVQFIGNPSENLGSIRITAVRLLDEGTFTCIFSVFPSGAYTTEIPLTVLVPPIVSVTVDVPPVIGENEVVLATCVAACAKPQAEVTWKTGAFGSLLRTVTNSTQHANGTTTVLSHLLGVPTRAANQQQVQCVVNQSALATERSYNYTIDIHLSELSAPPVPSPGPVVCFTSVPEQSAPPLPSSGPVVCFTQVPEQSAPPVSRPGPVVSTNPMPGQSAPPVPSCTGLSLIGDCI